jgi:hypothetical protein
MGVSRHRLSAWQMKGPEMKKNTTGERLGKKQPSLINSYREALAD